MKQLEKREIKEIAQQASKQPYFGTEITLSNKKILFYKGLILYPNKIKTIAPDAVSFGYEWGKSEDDDNIMTSYPYFIGKDGEVLCGR